MTSNRTTRAARAKAGKCVVCLKRARRPSYTTCRACGDAITSYSARRYKARRDAHQCTRCGVSVRVDPDTGRYPYLCPDDAEAKNASRRL